MMPALSAILRPLARALRWVLWGIGWGPIRFLAIAFGLLDALWCFVAPPGRFRDELRDQRTFWFHHDRSAPTRQG